MRAHVCVYIVNPFFLHVCYHVRVQESRCAYVCSSNKIYAIDSLTKKDLVYIYNACTILLRERNGCDHFIAENLIIHQYSISIHYGVLKGC